MRMTEKRGFRRLVSLLCTAVLILSVTAVFAAEKFPFTARTIAITELYKSASTNSKALLTLDDSVEVKVTGRSGNYYKVTVKGKTGYVPVKALTGYEESSEYLATIAYGYPYETTANASVKLHEKNDKNSRVLGTVKKGAAVTVLGETNSYAHLQYGDLEGYAKKQYINMKKIVKATKAPATEAPLPTLAPGADSTNYATLQSESRGDAVTALQNALIELGFLTAGRADGIYGDATVAAVQAFQEKNGYPVTGVADANLQALIYSGKPLNASGAKTVVSVLAPIDGVTITSGKTGMLVGTVQSRLKELGYYRGSVNMVYDKATVSAMKKFQKANGLKADGVIGPDTQAVLFSAEALAPGVTAVPVTPEPTEAPTFARPSGTVERGSSGSDARLVQKRLKELGYYRGTVDGKFGNASVDALKRFQSNNNLNPDGKAGKATYDILFSWEARPANVTPTPVILVTLPPEPTAEPTATPTPAPMTRENTVTIRLGSTGDDVVRMQRRLTELGYYVSTADGVCKSDDVAAIRAFQTMNGLKADGAAGYDTLSKLYSETAVLYTGQVAAGIVGDVTTLRVGMSGAEVERLQQRLIDLGYLTGKADGIFGSGTSNALMAFQGNNGLKKDGIAGTATLQKLYGSGVVSAREAAAKATPAPAAGKETSSASTTLQRGDVSAAVKSMQERLIALGYLTGRADGKFGAKTYQALLAFQSNNKLKADGVAGSRTLTALESESAINASGAAATPKPTAVPTAASDPRPKAGQVRYENWYTTVKAIAKKYPYATVYDFKSGLSWQVHIFSLGAHADVEPLTANDTARMERAFGGNTWNPKAVWVVFGDGTVYMASTHSMPHGTQHRTANNFAGHCCIHFPRTTAQVTAIGPYATSHQACIDAGWLVTQSMK